MNALDGLAQGFGVAMTPGNLLIVLLGVTIGMVVGVLPGLGPTATIAILLPVTFSMEPASAIIMLAGIYYGAMYGGTITAVLVKVPGEVASVITTFDGYAMARQGRAGSALGVAAIGSFIGGVGATALLVLLAAPMVAVATKFGPPELFLVAALGVLLVLAIASGSLVKAALMAGLGFLLATVGQDPIDGSPRFTFGTPELLGGLDIVAIAMGLFGLGEVLHQLHTSKTTEQRVAVHSAYPTRQDLRQSAGPIARGSVIGSVLGLIPGGGSVLPPMASYAVERRRAKDPSRFGKGAIEGVAGPESANNAGAQTSFLPLLTLGLPTSSVMALVFGALLLQGVTPGPALVSDHPDIFWGIIASMFIGNLILLLMNLPLVGLFAQLLKIKPTIIGLITIIVTMVGVYSLNNSALDLVVAIIAGVVGYALRKTGFEIGPLILAMILGPMLEKNLRIALTMSDGDPAIFVTRPYSLTLVLLLGGLVALAGGSLIRRRRASRGITSHGSEETVLDAGRSR
jgi:putative tricarboxylic transport membrane protein